MHRALRLLSLNLPFILVGRELAPAAFVMRFAFFVGSKPPLYGAEDVLFGKKTPPSIEGGGIFSCSADKVLSVLCYFADRIRRMTKN